MPDKLWRPDALLLFLVLHLAVYAASGAAMIITKAPTALATLRPRAPQGDGGCEDSGITNVGDLPPCATQCQAVMSSDASYQQCIGELRDREMACQCMYLANCGDGCGTCWPQWYTSWSYDWCPYPLTIASSPGPLGQVSSEDIDLATVTVQPFTDVTVLNSEGQPEASWITPSGYAFPTYAAYTDSSQGPSETEVILASNASELIPWSWAIAPDDPESDCPGSVSILTTFAVVDVVTAALAVVFGHRLVVKFLTCKVFGKDGSFSWTILWVLQVGLHLGANAWVASGIVRSDQILQEVAPAVWDLMLFYVARPRLTWVVLTFFANAGSGGKQGGYWDSAIMQTLIAEMVLLLIGAYYMGRTAHFATSSGFYINKFPGSAPDVWDAKIMYAGALLYLVTALAAIVGYASAMAIVEEAYISGLIALFFGSLTWIATWLFWVGYVKVSGRLYATTGLLLHEQKAIHRMLIRVQILSTPSCVFGSNMVGVFCDRYINRHGHLK